MKTTLTPSKIRTEAEPLACFASGSNKPAEIVALSEFGFDIGVAADQLSEAAIRELETLESGLVFIDSGAFSEVDGDLGVVAEISDEEWTRRLAIYRRVAFALGDRLFVVAPDRVGDQDVTLERLERYAPELYEIARLGATVLVPMQRGELSQVAFADQVDEALGFDWTPAIPCKKGASSPTEVAAFVQARRPAAIHLLGLGASNRRAPEFLEACGPEVMPTLDSCWIRANIGRKPRPRKLTAGLDVAKAELGADAPRVDLLRRALAEVFPEVVHPARPAIAISTGTSARAA